MDLVSQAQHAVAEVGRDLLSRAAAFLLLQDSRSSYAIEGERPPQDRIQRWGRAIGEAGRHPVGLDELLRLQRIVIGDARFVKRGLREAGGFVGEHDRETRMAIPDHISASAEDLGSLIDGMALFDDDAARAIDPIVAATPSSNGWTFLFSCVKQTIEVDLPREIEFLARYDRFRGRIESLVDMPDRTIDLLFRFLRQNGGRLSRRARAQELAALTDGEAAAAETAYREIFQAT